MDGVAKECKRCGHLQLLAHSIDDTCTRCQHREMRVVEVDIVKRGTLNKFDADIIFRWAAGFTNALKKMEEDYSDLAQETRNGRYKGKSEAFGKVAEWVREDIFGKEGQDGACSAARHERQAIFQDEVKGKRAI